MPQTANQWLAAQSFSFLENLFAESVMDKRFIKKSASGCVVSTRSSGSGKSGKKRSRTDYPVMKRRCPDGKDRRFYLHHVSMLYKIRVIDSKAPLWSSKEKQVSHDCHNTSCVAMEHLSLCTAEYNRAKSNKHCIARVECSECKTHFDLCDHKPRCKTVKISVCSNCKEK